MIEVTPKSGLFSGNAAASDTLSERAAALVEQDILSGVFSPGERLGIQALSEHYGIGATPLREGLSRLVSRGFISAVGQKGFRVANVSEADLADITLVRTMVEKKALRLSIRLGGVEWEADILSALHRLLRSVEQDPEAMREGMPEFDHLHKAFHRSLIAACGSERLLRLHDDLYYQAYRYRRLMLRRLVYHEIVDAHRLLAEVVLSRKVEQAEDELARHLAVSIKVVYGEQET